MTPDWIGVARWHAKLPGNGGFWCDVRTDEADYEYRFIHTGVGQLHPQCYYDEREAARAYCIHHGLELEVLRSLVPPEELAHELLHHDH